LEQYGNLAEGLLQAFVLKGIGAVRDDTHHLLSVFAPELDAAYLAQRSGIGTPADAEEMMTALLASEFMTAINDRNIPEDVLGADASVLALKIRDEPGSIKLKKYKNEPVYGEIVKVGAGDSKHIIADKECLELLCRVGFDGQALTIPKEARQELEHHFFPDSVEAVRILSRFARLASYSREANEPRRMGTDRIGLTGGMILRAPQGDGHRYLLCVQPGCDAVRLSDVVPFPFCKLKESKGAFDLVLSAEGEEKRFKVERKPRDIQMLQFAADPAKRMVISEEKDGKPGFTDSGGTFWEFLAELRPLEAQHFTSLLINKFNRVALNGSEWLRLHGSSDGD
jgi:hypothetical protein